LKEKFLTLIWFFSRPTFYRHGFDLFLRKFRKNFDSSFYSDQARDWAKQQTVSVEEALKKIGLIAEGQTIPSIDEILISEASSLASTSKVEMGGAGDIHLIYATALLSGSKMAIETGVAYGWSSLSILAALKKIPGSLLVSVDMPYPKMNNEDSVGIAIPIEFKKNWQLLREPDRKGIKKAIKMINGPVDLCHYDSDKSYYGRVYGYPLLWDSLKEGGIFISDDIQDNLAFKELVERKKTKFAVTEYEGKYIGITLK
tara:strand:- start:1044 stop:1814 length:771 start_codon:yes stop_codon:yes gene_type:complete